MSQLNIQDYIGPDGMLLGNPSFALGTNETLRQAEQTAPTAPTAPAAPVGPTQAQLDPLMAALSSTDTMRTNAQNEARSLYSKNISAYNAEDANDRQNYDKQVQQNEGNLATNRWASLLQGAQGAQGLRAVLGSLGALSGTGGQLADRAVASAANKDIGEANETFNTNAEGLNMAWQGTEREQRQRRSEADAARDNDLRGADSSWAQSRQGILTQLANLFGAGTSQGAQYSSEAAALYPQVAQGSNRAVASYQAASPLYSQQALDTYKGGVRDLSVNTRGGATPGGPALVAAPTPRRRDEELA